MRRPPPDSNERGVLRRLVEKEPRETPVDAIEGYFRDQRRQTGQPSGVELHHVLPETRLVVEQTLEF